MDGRLPACCAILGSVLATSPAGRLKRAACLAAVTLLVLPENGESQQQPQHDQQQRQDGEATRVVQLSQPLASFDGFEPERRPSGTRLDVLVEFRALVDQERYEEAMQVGKELLRLTEQDPGPRTLEMADAYTELAHVQGRLEEHGDAEINFFHAIDLYRDLEGLYAEELIEPLVLLGDNYLAGGHYENAFSVYSEARAVSRRAHGLFNDLQIRILDRATTTLLAMNRHAEAQEQQLAILEVVERSHPAGSAEVLDAIYRYALWLRSIGRFREEREQYEHAIRVIWRHHGYHDTLMVKPLRETANSYRIQGRQWPDSLVRQTRDGRTRVRRLRDGPDSLERALDVLERQQEPDPLMLAELMRDMGDWQTAFGERATDGAEYRRAWELLGRVEGGEQLREDWFTGAHYVLCVPARERRVSNGPDAADGRIAVEVDLDLSGRVENVAVTDTDPQGFMEEAYVEAVRDSRFRPQMVGGDLVRGEKLPLELIFRHSPEPTDPCSVPLAGERGRGERRRLR